MNLLRFQLSNLNEPAYLAKLKRAFPDSSVKITVKSRQLTVSMNNSWGEIQQTAL